MAIIPVAKCIVKEYASRDSGAACEYAS